MVLMVTGEKACSSLGTQVHETGHLVLGQGNVLAAQLGQLNLGCTGKERNKCASVENGQMRK